MIDRSKTRDIPLHPSAVKGRSNDWNLCRGNHLGQRSCAGAKTQAGHMDASDLIRALPNSLRGAGRPHMGSGHSLKALICRSKMQ